MCQVQAGRLLGTYPELWKIVGLLQLACHALRLGFAGQADDSYPVQRAPLAGSGCNDDLAIVPAQTGGPVL